MSWGTVKLRKYQKKVFLALFRFYDPFVLSRAKCLHAKFSVDPTDLDQLIACKVWQTIDFWDFSLGKRLNIE